MSSLNNSNINTIRINELESQELITGRELLLIENQGSGNTRKTTVDNVSSFIQTNVMNEVQPQLDMFIKLVVMYSGKVIPPEERDPSGQTYYIRVTQEFDEGTE